MMIARFRRAWPPGIRTQLTLWYTLIFALLILLFSSIFYTTLKTWLASSVDTALQLRTEQIAEGISSDEGTISIRDVTGELPELSLGTPTTSGDQDSTSITRTCSTENTSSSNTSPTRAQTGVNFGILVRILDAKGQTCYVTPAFHQLIVPSASISQSLKGIPWQDTVRTRDGQEVRLNSRALVAHGAIFGVVQVGESLAGLTTTLHSVAIGLLVTIPFVLLLSALGSYWLARRAFKPIHHLIRTAQDIGERDLHQRVPVPRARDEVQDLALVLNAMVARLERAFTQQRRFVADASHELRTPIAVIRSMTDVALAQSLSQEEYIDVLREVSAESERLGKLANDLLTLARADEKQVQLDHDPVRLDLLANDVVESMESLAVERNITLQVGKLEPATVMGDTARLIQVMMSLVNNALTYTNAGGTVTLTVETDRTGVCIAVRDTGIGITPEDAAHIFERFYRADPARSRAAGGSGLGLAIVDWIVRAHGGSVAVESQVGEGSTFTVTLPLAKD